MGNMGVMIDKNREFLAGRGFTLVELMVTITIASILMTIAVGAWGALREKTRVKSTAEEIRSVLTAARLQALSTRSNASVAFDFAGETVTSSLWTAPRVYKGVDLVAYTFSSCTVQAGSASNTITFKSTSSAFGSAGVSGNLALLVRPKGAVSPAYYLVVNGVTGRVKMREACP